MKNVKVGYQMDGNTQMGPVVNEKQRKRVLSYLEKGVKEGAKMVVEGGPAEVAGKTGHYVKPALMEGTLENVAAREEIFGPVAYLAKFESEDRSPQDGEQHRLRPRQQRLVDRPQPLLPRRRTNESRQQLDQRPQRVPPRRTLRRHRQVRPRRRRQQPRNPVRLLAQRQLRPPAVSEIRSRIRKNAKASTAGFNQ